MNDIVYPMKVHAVKLEYRRLMLEKMPHGYLRKETVKHTLSSIMIPVTQRSIADINEE